MKNMGQKKRRVRYEHGLIAGRFQPFHSGHLRLAIAAAEAVDHLWVGITRPFGNYILEIGGSRTNDKHNPLPYWLRFKCVESALLCDAKIPRIKFSILPLPLVPVVIEELLPPGAVFLTNIVEEWSLEKEKLFVKAGLKVLRLDVGPKAISSTLIRRKIRMKDQGWKEHVPKSIRHHYSKIVERYVRKGE